MPFFGGGGGDYHIIVTNIKGGTDAAPSVVGSDNMALGNGALQNATLCDYNIAIGNNAGNSLADGGYNVIIGGLAGNVLQQSSDTNIIIGYHAAFNSPASSRGNVIIGTGAYSNVALSVDNCVILGVNAQNLSGANNSVTIGANSNSGNNSIAIKGTAGNNAIVIGDVSQSSIFIGGLDFSAGPGQLPAGNDTEIQFNSGGAFGADPLFTYSAGVLSTPNAIVGDPGTEGTGVTIGGVLYNSVFKVSDISSTDIAQSIIHRHSTTWEPIQVFARSNSNGSGHGVVTNGMLLSSQYTAGWTGTEYNLFGRAGFEAAAAGTISDASSPGDFVIATTPDGGTLPVEAVRVKSDKSTVFAGGVVYPASTFAALPAASVALNQIFRVTDIGPDGSLWESNGSEWKPVNGKALLKIGNYPVGMPNNGSIGANGAVTFTGTGLVDTYSGGIWLYYPAGALYAGSLAGFYWTVMTSATVGTVYNGMHDGATEFLPALAGTLTPIVSTAIGAFLAVGVNTQVSMFSIPANALGEFGTIEGIYSTRFTSSASSKSITAFMGAGFVTINATTATTTNSFNGFIKTRNRGAGKQINNFNGLVQTPNTGGITQTAVDTTISTPIVFALNNTGSNNDCLILESVELYISK